MTQSEFQSEATNFRIKALTFDVLGTILDLPSSLTPFIAEFLGKMDLDISADDFYSQWRSRQRVEQFQDTIIMLGHSGYLETLRRALVYTLKLNGIECLEENVKELMDAWQELSPFPEVRSALERLGSRYKLIVLSNGDPKFLDYLVENRIQYKFDKIISAVRFGFFKPHPSIYRGAAKILRLDVNECMMVSVHSFDLVGARACGFRAAYVNRYNLPYDDSPFTPDLIVDDFVDLADAIL